MKTIEIEVFTIDELCDEAKEKAHENWLQNFDFDDDEARATLKKFEEIFPVNVTKWEYGYHNFIDFIFTEDEDIEELSGHRLATYIWNNYKDDIYKGKFYSTPGQWIDGKFHYKFRYSKITIEADNCPLTGMCYDLDILDPIIKFMKNPDGTDFKQLLYECLQALIYSLRDEYEARQTLECFIEDAQANEWEYLIDGRSKCF